MKTAFILMAQYNGQAVIPVDTVCRDYFAPLTVEKFLQKTLNGEIALPVVRMYGSQKAARGVHLNDLAAYLDSEMQDAHSAPPIKPVRTWEEKRGVVYFVGAGDLVKIGFSTNFPERLTALQIGSPVQLEVIATVAGTYSAEKSLHRQFAHLRAHGEWFRNEGKLAEWIRGGCHDRP